VDHRGQQKPSAPGRVGDATNITPIGTAIAYHFTGPAPDSMRADGDGNPYVAMYGQARVLAFNRNGIPIGQVLPPGRDEGHNLWSTSMAIKPSADDLFIVTNEGSGGQEQPSSTPRCSRRL
jgi:lactonase